MDWGRPVFFINAAAHLGLLEAAALAERLGRAEQHERWSAMAVDLLHAYRRLMASLPLDSAELRNERTTINAVYPTEAAEPERVRALLARQWRGERRDDGSFRAAPAWTYFSIAQAHQWLRLGEPQRAWTTLDWFAVHDRVPGLWIFWEGSGEENRFGLWNDVRGNVAPRGITPHYWTSAEAQLLAIEMLAFAERRQGRIVIGAGVPREWITGPLAVERIGTALGQVSWWYDGNGRVRVSVPDGVQVVLGPGFPPGTALERIQSAARNEKNADDDEAHAGDSRRAERLAEEIPGGDRVQDIAERKHRVGDAHVDARKAHHPDDEAHQVAEDAAQYVRLEREAQRDRANVLRDELESPDGVGAGFQQQLRSGIQHHAGQDQKVRGAHAISHAVAPAQPSTVTRRCGSRKMSCEASVPPCFACSR